MECNIIIYVYVCVCDYCVKAMTKAMHSCLARFCKNSVGASLFRFLKCLISRSTSSSSSDWSAASCPRRDKLLSVRVPCLRGVVCVVTRDSLRGWAYSFCLSDLSAERKVLFFLTRRGHVISPRQIEQTGEAVRTAPTSPPAGHVAIGEFPVT